MEKTESQIVREICALLDRTAMKGCYSVTNSSGSHFFRHGHLGRKGWPDITGIIPDSGRFFAIEAKTRTGVLTKEQKATLSRLTLAGGLVMVARSADDVLKVLEKVS